MHLIRSILFAILLTVITVPYAFLATFIFWLPPMTRHRLITSWVPIMMWVIRHVLGIRYRVIGDGEFNHTSALVLLDADGRVAARTEIIGSKPDPAFVAAVRKAVGP